MQTLITKFKRSQVGLESTEPAFQQLTDTCMSRKLPVNSWKLAESLAMEERGESLRIFDINHEKAPTLAQIRLRLTDSKENSNDGADSVNWVADGIKIQNDQYVFSNMLPTSVLISPRSRLRYETSKLPKKPTVKQQLKVSRMRASLGKQVKDYLKRSSTFLSAIEETEFKPLDSDSIDTPPEESVEPEDFPDFGLDGDILYEEEDESEEPSVLPEATVLPLPSNIISPNLRSSVESLVETERELRKGQANDALEGIRIGLANKSLLLQNDVNKSNSTKQSTRAWASVRNAQSQILVHARSYQRAWEAIRCIGTPEDLAVYRKLEGKDLVVVKDITKAKRFGQGSHALAWFWRIGPSEDELTGEWMEECKSNPIFQFCLHMLIYSISLPC